MTEKRVYYDCVGPYFYDDEDDLDASEGLFVGRKQAAITTDGKILIVGGAGVTLEGGDSYGGGYVHLNGSSYNTRFMANGSGSLIYLIPESRGDVGLRIGAVPTAGTPAFGEFATIYMMARTEVYIDVDDGSGTDNTYRFLPGSFQPAGNKTADCGHADYAWDDVYADDFQNVADFLHLDDRDDLAALEQIKGSGIVDERTGLEMIDDNTIPEWMVSKDKKTKEVLRDPEGKPYLSLRLVTSLLMGACRQLNKKIEELEKKIEVKNA